MRLEQNGIMESGFSQVSLVSLEWLVDAQTQLEWHL